ncbi:Uncharacterised protein [Klebsiella pneumoniae]|uniref:hypothetical protein n=1 Tax=Klebsiella pneumoniae TaxID=573 RepID=UPI000E2C7C80|nr:hypothetical protein [Klebsiella pneumoniae]SWV05789.1 Uncharacterised protein [Klebsiella pneumoniae]
MTITLQAVNGLIASLESTGELSIREQKFLKLAKAFKQLAAENVALKAVFSQEEIPSEAVDAFMETAVMDHDWNETSEWSWVENETEVIHAVLDALKPDTPATDRIVAGIKADGVEGFAAMTEKVGDEEEFYDNGESSETLKYTAKQARLFAKQLRERADK